MSETIAKVASKTYLCTQKLDMLCLKESYLLTLPT